MVLVANWWSWMGLLVALALLLVLPLGIGSSTRWDVTISDQVEQIYVSGRTPLYHSGAYVTFWQADELFGVRWTGLALFMGSFVLVVLGARLLQRATPAGRRPQVEALCLPRAGV